EDDPRAVGDLRQRELLALRLVVPRLGIAPRDLDPGDGALRPGPVARDVPIDGRLLEAADGADRLRTLALGRERAEVADQIADLLLFEEEADDVLRLALEVALIDVDDCEVRVREPLCRRRDRVALREPDANDQVISKTRERDHVGDVLRGRGRLDDSA